MLAMGLEFIIILFMLFTNYYFQYYYCCFINMMMMMMIQKVLRYAEKKTLQELPKGIIWKVSQSLDQ